MFSYESFLDLVVGAPFYYARDHGGAIYIYENSPNVGFYGFSFGF